MSHYDEARGLLSQQISTVASQIAAAIHAATSKDTPVDADELPLVDSAASFGLKRLTWANLKATLKTYLDTLYVALATTASPTIAPATPTTIATVVSGRYEIAAYIPFSGAIASFSAFATVIADGNASRIAANNGASLTITLSGMNVQITQNTGSNQTVVWSVLKVS